MARRIGEKCTLSEKMYAGSGARRPPRAAPEKNSDSSERLFAIDDHALPLADGKLQIGVTLHDLLRRF